MTDHTAPLYIDLAGTLIETEARYAISSEWDGRHLISADATLTEWFCNDEWRPRAKLEAVLSACGDRHGKELKANEDRAAGEWCETAERDARDDWADSRSWAAE